MSVHTTTSSVVRRRLAVWSLLPVLAMTAACSGDESATDDPGSTESPSKPYDTDTIVPAMQQALGDATSARVQMELTGQIEMSVDGQMAMTEEFEDGELEMTIEVQGQSIDLRMVDGLIYVSGPPATPAGKWLEVDPQDPQDPLAQQFANLIKSGDLSTTLDAFEKGLEDVEHVGAEEIDGEAVDHYVLAVDAAKAAEAQGQPAAPDMPETLDYDVWLTQDDLMRRVAFAFGPVEAEVNATEWGESVDVEAPAPDDIVERPAA